MIPAPSQLNIPHDSWRPGQYEAIEYIANTSKKITLLSAPVGSGKTAVGLALGSRGKSVRALTFTRALQKQYGDYPDVEVLYGLNAYSCGLLNGAFQADMCAFSSNMLKCSLAGMNRCEYVNQRTKTKMSLRQALSYQYYFKASWVHKLDAVVDYLYCDEAHSLPQGIMSEMAFEIEPHQLSKLDLPPIPMTPDSQVVRMKFILGWLEKLLAVLDYKLELLDLEQGDEQLSVNKTKYKKALAAIQSSAKITFIAMDNNRDDFYIHIEDTGKLKIFPLTPAPFFYYLFNLEERDTKIALASATLGNHAEFAKLLGLKKNDWGSHTVPPVYPPESQPVFYYSDGPRMGYKSGVSEQKQQIELIRQNINDFPSDTNVLIHFSSIKTTKEYARILTYDYGSRIWIPDENHTTEEKLAAWELQKKRHPGTICLSWCFAVGVDAPDVSLVAIQKVPYLMLDEVNGQILKRNPRLYKWIAAIGIEQAAGRHRRGEPEHYERAGEKERKRTVILDNNFRMIKSLFSPFFLDCLVKI